MSSTNAVFWKSIPAGPELAVESKKPHYLEERVNKRASKRQEDAVHGPNADEIPPSFASSPSSALELAKQRRGMQSAKRKEDIKQRLKLVEEATEYRNEQLQARAHKAALRSAKVLAKATERERLELSTTRTMQGKLTMRLISGCKRREEQLSHRSTLCGAHLKYVHHVRSQSNEIGSCVKTLCPQHATPLHPVVVLQRWWRAASLRKTIHALKPVPLLAHDAGLAAMDYEDLAARLQDRRLLRLVAVALNKLAITFPKLLLPRNNHRVFLSSYMMAYFPEALFDRKDQATEHALQAKASKLVQVFSKWILQDHFSECDELLSHWVDFSRAFTEWKERDKQKLVDQLVAQYKESRKLEHTVQYRMHESEVDSWLENIHEQQLAILKRLRQLAATETLASLQDYTDEPSPRKHCVSTTSDESDDPEQSSALKPKLTVSEPERRYVIAPRVPQEHMASPSMTHALGNSQIVHEVALDEEFRLDIEPPGSLQERVRAVMERAFYDRLKEEFDRSPPNYSALPSLIAEMRDSMIELLVNGHDDVQQSIYEILDLQVIQQQITRGVFEPASLMKFIVSTLAKICAPTRDVEVTELGRATSLTVFIQNAHRLLRVMKIDVANYHLQAARPEITAHAAQYERENFALMLEEKTTGLDNTRTWLGMAIDSVHQNPAAVVEGISLADYVNEMFVQLLGHSTTVDIDTLPEPLLLDSHRILLLNARLQVAVKIACYHTLALTVAPQLKGIRDFNDKLFKGLMPLVADSKCSAADVFALVLDVINQILMAQGAPALSPDRCETLSGLLGSMYQGKHPVRAILHRRALAIMRKALSQHQISQEANKLQTAGLEAVHAELEVIAQTIALLGTYNKEVYAPYYDAMLGELLVAKQVVAPNA